jgi:hypothetical protein
MREIQGQCIGFDTCFTQARGLRKQAMVFRLKGSQCARLSAFITSATFAVRASGKNFDAFRGISPHMQL